MGLNEFITADALIAHAIGDYVLQSDWMANEKRYKSSAAMAHALTYSIPFLFLTQSLYTFAFIILTHFIIDRWRLARYVCWAKNFIFSPWNMPELRALFIMTFSSNRTYGYYSIWNGYRKPWKDCSETGYPIDRPVWMTVWLMIIADNVMHVICNGVALRWIK